MMFAGTLTIIGVVGSKALQAIHTNYCREKRVKEKSVYNDRDCGCSPIDQMNLQESKLVGGG